MLVCSSSQDGSSYPIILHYYRVYINIQNTSSKCIDHNTVLYYCSLFIIPHHVIYHHIMYINMSLQCVAEYTSTTSSSVNTCQNLCMSAVDGLFSPKETTVESSVYSSKEGSNNYHLHHQNLDCLGIPKLRLKTVYDFKKFGTVSSIFMVKYMDKQQPVIYARKISVQVNSTSLKIRL